MITSTLRLIDRKLWKLPESARKTLFIGPLAVSAACVAAGTFRDGVRGAAVDAVDDLRGVWEDGMWDITHPPAGN